jgi:hypothetical protein
MIVIHILYWLSFITAIICLPAVRNVDIRRRYGRIFGTRIDTTIYHKIFYSAITTVIILFFIMLIVG